MEVLKILDELLQFELLIAFTERKLWLDISLGRSLVVVAWTHIVEIRRRVEQGALVRVASLFGLGDFEGDRSCVGQALLALVLLLELEGLRGHVLLVVDQHVVVFDEQLA